MSRILDNSKKFVKKILAQVFFRYDNFDYPYRSYFNEYKCLLVHIPKTAGTSILSALSDGVFFRDHCKYKVLYDASPSKFSSFFKFCFVRNPFDRAFSTYTYLKAGGNGTTDLYWMKKINESYPTFEMFVMNYLDSANIHEHPIFVPQYLFIFDYKYKLMVDFVGRFETIDEDFKFVAEKIGLVDELPHHNKSKHQKNDFRNEYINDEMRQKVAGLYRKDFELLGYETQL